MKILVACEESQEVTKAFRKLGHEAFSCDIADCSGGYPEWHLKQDVRPLLDEQWDMIIAFPPCTYMSNAGACRMYPTKGNLDQERLKLGFEAKEFFMMFANAKCEKIVIENPRPLNVIGLPKESQRIQPFMFGHPFTKMTYLWLKGVPELQATDLVTDNVMPFVSGGSFSSNGQRRKKQGIKRSAKQRSKTFPGVAAAMAQQWG